MTALAVGLEEWANLVIIANVAGWIFAFLVSEKGKAVSNQENGGQRAYAAFEHKYKFYTFRRISANPIQ
ncbi:MAG: hypothetical protein ACJZ8W_09855 [Limisphaerales bacterium]